MGQDELVLKIPGAASNSTAVSMSPPGRPAETGRAPDARTGNGKSARDVVGGCSRKISGKKPGMTHSRESSGASVKFVNCGSTADNTVARGYLQHRRNLSKGSGGASGTEEEEEDTESHVIIMSPSEQEAGSLASEQISLKSVGCEDEDLASAEERLSPPTTEEEVEERLRDGGSGIRSLESLNNNNHCEKKINARRKKPPSKLTSAKVNR